jgi:acetyl-CoA synthetase
MSDAKAQETEWQAFVSQARAQPNIPFDVHWARYLEIFAARPAEAGPPPAWRPSEEQLAASNLGRLIDELGYDSYSALHAWSVDHRADFWEMVIERLGIVLLKPPVRLMGNLEDPRHPEWLPSAQMNCVDSCFTSPREKPAVIVGSETTESLETLSYGELERLVDRVANGLLRHGFSVGDAIALYMPMTLECVAAYLGIVRAGCRVVSIADSFSPVEIAKRMKIGQARSVITVASFLRGGKRIGLYDKVRQAAAEHAIVIPSVAEDDSVVRDGDLSWIDLLGDDEPFESRIAEPYHITNVLFSSGTTADPKAIPWTHLTPIKCAMDGHFHQDIRTDDVVAWPTNIGWMMGPWLIYASLINGASMALYEGSPSGEGFTRFVRQAGVSVLGTVPSLVRAWRTADAVPFSAWEGVRVFSSTGEPSNREDYLWLMSRSGYRAPVIEYCGGTEIGGGYITGTVVQPASPATFTTPTLGLDFVILDPENAPVDAGGEGELFLRPPSIGLSEELLNRDHDDVYYSGCPAGPSGEVLRRHGDQMVRLHEGFYKAHGRADDTMNLSGIKISSRELESVIENHDAVYESAAIAVQPEGEGAEKLIVYIVTHGEVDCEQLKTDIGSLIAQRINPLFKIHELIVANSLPRTASNKLMRRALRAAYMER